MWVALRWMPCSSEARLGRASREANSRTRSASLGATWARTARTSSTAGGTDESRAAAGVVATRAIVATARIGLEGWKRLTGGLPVGSNADEDYAPGRLPSNSRDRLSSGSPRVQTPRRLPASQGTERMEDALAGAVLGGRLIVIEGRNEDDRRTAEKSLVDQARAGDLLAFERLYRENVRKVYALCLRMSSNAALAEELTQEVFVRAWRKLDTFRGESAFSSWLYPIAVNVALSERRSRRRREARIFSTDDLEGFDRTEGRPAPEAGFDLERAMAALPPGARAVFVLHDVEGRTHEEIAAMLGLASGTSKTQLHPPRPLLREALRS